MLSEPSAFELLYPLIEPVQALVYGVQAFPYPVPELVLRHPSLWSAPLAIPEAASSSLAVPIASLASTAALSSAAAFPISSSAHVTFLLHSSTVGLLRLLGNSYPQGYESSPRLTERGRRLLTDPPAGSLVNGDLYSRTHLSKA